MKKNKNLAHTKWSGPKTRIKILNCKPNQFSWYWPRYDFNYFVWIVQGMSVITNPVSICKHVYIRYSCKGEEEWEIPHIQLANHQFTKLVGKLAHIVLKTP